MGQGTECVKCGGTGWVSVENRWGGVDDLQCHCTVTQDIQRDELCPACDGDGWEVDPNREPHKTPCSVCFGER